jgi:hypothetical protein
LHNIDFARDLTELVEKFKVFNRSGEVGAGTTCVLIGSLNKTNREPMNAKEHRSDNITLDTAGGTEQL